LKCPECQAENPDNTKFCGECGASLAVDLGSLSPTKTILGPVLHLKKGQKIAGKYKIAEKIGEGGMGIVYKAEDTKLKRNVALKFLPSELTRDKKAKARFIQEAQAAAALNHPHICIIHEVDEADNQTFIAMEFVEGQTLKDKIEAGPLGVEDAVDIASQVAEGLAEAHKKGIVHRDIKPANIMLTESGKVKIMDFGLAKLSWGADLTKPSMIMGTVAYMSPEQARGEPVDHRADIWSLGAMLYEMLTGEKPFQKNHEHALIHAILNDEPQRIPDVRSDVPAYLEKIIKKALEKNIDRRFQTAQEMLEELKQSPPLVFPGAKKSIVVLPFKNMSPEEGQEYFCDGLTEELINSLYKIRALKVVARTSAFAFKGKDLDIRDVGRKLSVETALEGSVRKSGNQLRVTAQLINVSDGYHLWSERFDYEMANVFELQDRITLAIVDKLKVHLDDQEKKQIVKRFTENVEAYNLYLKGRYFINLISEDGFQKGLACFNQAINLDPGYALAYTGIAEYYINVGWYSIIPPIQAFEKAKRYVEKAIELDPSLPEAHFDRAILIFAYEWDLKGAANEFEYAMALNPAGPSSFLFYSCYFVDLCRYDEAIKIAKKIVELDPLSPAANLWLGWVFFEAERFDDSIEQLKKVLELNPGQLIAQQEIAWNYAFQGKCKEAIAEYERMGEADMGIAWGDTTRGCVYALCGRKDVARKTCDEMLKLAAQRYIDPSYLAALSASLDDKDKAFEWLQRAYKEKSVIMVYLKNYAKSWFKNISSDPRYKELLGKVGFEP
jgi:serine/threonine protein kinase